MHILLQRFIRQNLLRAGHRRILREILRKSFDLLHGIIPQIRGGTKRPVTDMRLRKYKQQAENNE